MNRNLHAAMISQYAASEISGNGRVEWDNGVKCVIPSVTLYGAAVQEGTPSPDAPILPVCNDGVFAARGRNLCNTKHITIQQTGNMRFPICMPGIYTFSAVVSCDDTDSDVNVFIVYSPDRKQSKSGYIGRSNGNERVSVSFEANFAFDNIQLYASNRNQNAVGDTAVFSDIQIVRGYTDAEYEPYYDGGQASAPELWAIPDTDIRDEWDTQTGRGMRRCAVVSSYAGEEITTPYISSTGELSEGAMVVYGISDAPFQTEPQKLTMQNGYGQILQVSGSVSDCKISAKYMTHS